MKPVTQVGLTCYAACIASILEMPLEDVCRPMKTSEQEFDGWLIERNLYPVRIPIEEATPWAPPGYIMLWGIAADDYVHCVVCFDGEVVWNPDDEGTGKLVRPLGWIMLCVLDPTLPTGISLRKDVPSMAEIAARAKASFDEMLHSPAAGPHHVEVCEGDCYAR
jgi:hypothetical protein